MNYSLHTDLYQLNMAYSYFNDNVHEDIATFEMFFRHNPFNGGHAIFAGLEKVIELLENYKFEKDEIEYLRKEFNYSEEFLDYLSNLKFSGDLYSVKEGEVIFSNEPLLIIKAPLIQAQLLETVILFSKMLKMK